MKRIISILILISVLFQAFYMNIGYADEFISETEKDKFVNDIRFLESIGVLNEDVRKNPEETLTRAELARILTCMDVNGILVLVVTTIIGGARTATGCSGLRYWWMAFALNAQRRL
ncbi:MAG: hypothetical protein IJQ50_07055, partial [Clostridia bacterium]|nr:hypothetical protein [Clostridia bacterium]